MSPFTQKSAAQRLVLFVGGFDPRGAAYYHRLMRQQAQLQSAVVGAAYQIGPRERWPAGEQADLPHAAWRVSSAQGQSADYVFYDWSDVVRSHWPKSRWAVASQALKTYALVWKERRCLGPLHQQTPYTLWTLAYPLVYGLLFVLFAVLAAWGAVQATNSQYSQPGVECVGCRTDSAGGAWAGVEAGWGAACLVDHADHEFCA